MIKPWRFLPTATRAMQHWVESKNRGFAQGITHSLSRVGNALTPVVTVALSAPHPDWFVHGGTHLQRPGEIAYMDLIKNAVQ